MPRSLLNCDGRLSRGGRNGLTATAEPRRRGSGGAIGKLPADLHAEARNFGIIPAGCRVGLRAQQLRRSPLGVNVARQCALCGAGPIEGLQPTGYCIAELRLLRSLICLLVRGRSRPRGRRLWL